MAIGPSGSPKTPNANVVHLASTGILTCIKGTSDKFYMGHVGYDTTKGEWVGWLHNGRNGTAGQTQTPLSTPNLRQAINHVNDKVTKKASDKYDLAQQSGFSHGWAGAFAPNAESAISAAQGLAIGTPAPAAPAAPAPTPPTPAAKPAPRRRAAPKPTLSEIDALTAAAAQAQMRPISLLLDDD